MSTDRRDDYNCLQRYRRDGYTCLQKDRRDDYTCLQTGEMATLVYRRIGEMTTLVYRGTGEMTTLVYRPKKRLLLVAWSRTFPLGRPRTSMIQASCSTSFSPGNKGYPVYSSARIQPKLHMSMGME